MMKIKKGIPKIMANKTGDGPLVEKKKRKADKLFFIEEVSDWNNKLATVKGKKKKQKKLKVHNNIAVDNNEMNIPNGSLATEVATKKKFKKQQDKKDKQKKADQCNNPLATDDCDIPNGSLATKVATKKKSKKQQVKKDKQKKADQCNNPLATDDCDIAYNEANVSYDELVPAPVAVEKRKKLKVRSEKQAKIIDEPSFNIDLCKNPLESEDHWALRRAFLEKNQHVLEPDELICLSQVYINVELYGCQYPAETMQMVEKCAEGLGKDYYHRKALMLKRTLICASDAAACKVRKLNILNELTENADATRRAIDENNDSTIPTSVLNRLRSDFIILNNDMRISMNTFNSLKNGLRIEAKTYPGGKNMYTGIVKIGDITIAKSCDSTSKKALRMAMNNAVEFLSKYCYSITRKKQAHKLSDVEVVTKSEVKSDEKKVDDQRLDADNVGFKLLAKLGWNGGGLGARGGGIVDPVVVEQKTGRDGLGLDEEYKAGAKMNVANIKQKLKDFQSGNIEDHHIVFSREYSKEERKIIHEFANKLGLKSQSHGHGSARQLVVSRRVNSRPVDLLRKVLVEKDPTFCEMYVVTYPTE